MNSLVALANSPIGSMAKGIAWDYVINTVDNLIDGNPEEIEAKKQGFNYRLERAVFDYNSIAPGFTLSPNPKELTDIEHNFFVWGYSQGFFKKQELVTFGVQTEGLGENITKRNMKAAELFGGDTKNQDVSSVEKLNKWSVNIGFMTPDEISVLPQSIS